MLTQHDWQYIHKSSVQNCERTSRSYGTFGSVSYWFWPGVVDCTVALLTIVFSHLMVWSRLSLLGNHTPVTRFWTLLSRSYLATCVEFSPQSRVTTDEHTFVLTRVEVSPRRRLTKNELIPWPTLSILRVLVLRKSVADFKLVSSRQSISPRQRACPLS